MIRVPLMHGFPWQTLGLTLIRSRQFTMYMFAHSAGPVKTDAYAGSQRLFAPT
jgi:hypothetical protein